MRIPRHPSASWGTQAHLWFWVGGIFALLALCKPSLALSAAKTVAPGSACITARRWKRWERYQTKLRGLLDRIERPPLREIETGGRKYQLPLLAKDAEVADCSRAELQYLSGFFDGDGCVFFGMNGAVRLEVKQSLPGMHVLFRFRECFGGSICLNNNGHGTANPSLQWRVGGKAGKRAIAELARNSFTQYAKLRAAAEEGCQKVRANLQEFRAASKVPASFKVTWPYLSGFFDAEGCISIPARGPYIDLRISQKKPPILRKMLTFLTADGLDRWALYNYKATNGIMFDLRCTTSDACKQSLRKLLANNLSLKRNQALIALRLSASTRSEARKDMSQLVGRQNRYSRLGSDGEARSKQIDRRCAQIRTCKDENMKEKLTEELVRLKEEHHFKKFQYRCKLMSSDIRNMLDAGARFRPAGKIQLLSQTGGGQSRVAFAWRYRRE
eukprot:Skav230037  [mRNA]  locus=scaffold465:10939:12267:+ [translate_table: standard]